MAGLHREVGAFDVVAAQYERDRPGYPRAAIAHLVDALGIGPGRRVLDLAAGTGKLTRWLVGTGADVVAVEPVAGMRRELSQVLPGITVLDGTAEALPLDDATVDAATIAQAFHWFEAAVALDELYRVLRPDGAFALVWNHRDPSDPLQSAATEVIERHRADTPRSLERAWEQPLDADPRFDRQRTATFLNHQPIDRDGFVGRFTSVSFIAALERRERRRVAAELAAAFDRVAGGNHLAYTTEVHVLHRRPDRRDRRAGSATA